MERFASDDVLREVLARLDTAPNPEQELTTQVELAWHLRQRDPARAKNLLREAQPAVARLGSTYPARRRLAARAHLVDAELLWFHGNLSEAHARVAESLKLATADADQALVSDAHWLLISINHDLGETAQRQAALAASLTAATACRDEDRVRIACVAEDFFNCLSSTEAHSKEVFARTFANLSHPSLAVQAMSNEVMAALSMAEKPEVRIQYLTRAAELAQATGQMRRAVICLNNVGTDLESLNDPAASLEWFDRALSTARRIASPKLTAMALLQSAGAARKLARLEIAEELIEEAFSLLRDMRHSHTYVCALLARGEILSDRHRFDEARQTMQQAYDLLPRIEGSELAWYLTNGLAVATADTGDFDGAITYAHNALAQAQGNQDRIQEITTTCAIGKILTQREIAEPHRGQTEALVFIQRAVALAEREEGYTLPPDIVEDLATLHAARGNFKEAYEARTEAQAIRTRQSQEEAGRRIMALQVTHKTEQARLDAEVQRVLARAEQERSEALQETNKKLSLALLQLQTTQADLQSSNDALSRANTSLAEVSTTDPLTGLRNRRYFTARIETDIGAYGPATNDAIPDCLEVVVPDICFLLVDIDHFKNVNDTYGHAAGDKVLVEVAGRLQAIVRDGDYIIRWGGEEFLVVARGTCRDDAHLLAERIRLVVSEAAFSFGEDLAIQKTCSIGFSVYPVVRSRPNEHTWSQAVDLADKALYLAKRNGRNAWVGITSVRAHKQQDRLTGHRVGDLIEAAARGRVELVTSSPTVVHAVEQKRLRPHSGFMATIQ